VIGPQAHASLGASRRTTIAPTDNKSIGQDRSDDPDHAQARIEDPRELLRAYVEYHVSTGVDGFARDGRIDSGPSPVPATHPSRSTRPAPTSAARIAQATDADGSALAAAATLDEVRTVLGDCRRCKLCSGRTHIVFGVGAADADLMFIGEGPGYNEDQQGEPFVGAAGQLLTDIITKGMRLRREDVYIANVVKCRPPENRDPEADEVAACRPFLERQIALVQPRVLVALGRVALQALLGVKTPISRVRGQWHEFAGIKLMPTFHPAYLLHNPSDKRLVWSDIQKVMAELGLPV